MFGGNTARQQRDTHNACTSTRNGTQFSLQTWRHATSGPAEDCTSRVLASHFQAQLKTARNHFCMRSNAPTKTKTKLCCEASVPATRLIQKHQTWCDTTKDLILEANGRVSASVLTWSCRLSSHCFGEIFRKHGLQKHTIRKQQLHRSWQ